MRSPVTWFLILLGVTVVGPYLLGVRPRRRRDWLAIAITIAFMAVILFQGYVRSR
jgi:hypothetical protein